MKQPDPVFATAFIWSLLIICSSAQLNLDKIDLQSQLPEDIAKSNYSYNDFKELFRNKCTEVTGRESDGDLAYTEIELAFGALTECMNSLVNVTALQQEIQEASPLGELDVVFNKYCKKRSNATECFDAFTDKLLPCLHPEEQESQQEIKRIVQSLLNFVCHKDGDQIALFIAEEGPECLGSQRDNIEQCWNSTLSTFVNNPDIRENNKIKKLPKLVVGETECADIRNLELCVVRHLEHCTKITPANLIESMFNFIRNETVCRKYHTLPLISDRASNVFLDTSPNLMFSLFTFVLHKLYYF
ncbi:hypothetical protein KR215_012107 [Drosophila sulfurigaster]|nr:hypothetical protein KR215_012107 [Drosophila sulfurigaster]